MEAEAESKFLLLELIKIITIKRNIIIDTIAKIFFVMGVFITVKKK